MATAARESELSDLRDLVNFLHCQIIIYETFKNGGTALQMLKKKIVFFAFQN